VGTLPDRRQQLLAFFSADLANSTEFKNRHQGRYTRDSFLPPRWPNYFSEVFGRILSRFDEEQRRRRTSQALTLLSRPRLWKINGDELLFREIVVPGDDGLKWLAEAVDSFVTTIQSIDAELLPDGCGVRGCVWTAGFPIRNKEIRIPSLQNVRVIRTLEEERVLPDFDSGLFPRDDEGLVDYLGPDMDLGFRLAATSPPGRVVCSLDVGYFLTQRHEAPSLYHVGWRALKGIAGGSPYPILWLSPGVSKRVRHVWEETQGDQELETFLKAHPLQRTEFLNLANAYWEQMRDYFQRPYTSPDEITPDHMQIWRSVVEHDSPEYNPIILDEFPQA
jgi:hypothetical protein